MRIIATIEADLNRSALGTRSRMADTVADQTVLARTVNQVAQAKRLSGVFVVGPLEQEKELASLITGLPAMLRTHSVGDPGYRLLVQSARKWALESWRGGIGGACVLDEYLHTAVVASLARQERADAVLVVPGPCPLIDPVWIDRLIEYYESVAEETRLAFLQSPPGLTGIVYHTDLLTQMAERGIPPGWTLSFKPDKPEPDVAQRKCACPSPQPLRHASGRLIADTHRAMHLISDYLTTHDYGGAEHVGQWLIQREATLTPPLPREVEIELTTQRPPDSDSDIVLRPTVPADRARGPIDMETIDRLARELSVQDDALVVLGGFGEPLLHPEFPQVLATLRNAGIYGVAVRTSGRAWSDAAIHALVQHKVDVVGVLVDAWTPERYRALHGNDLQTVLNGIERLGQVRQKAAQPVPFINAELIKCAHTLDELEPFVDGWIRRQGCVTLTGYSTYAGALPDSRVMDMSPPVRAACRQLRERCTVLANGQVLACDQDFLAARPVGSLHHSTLAALWTGPAMEALRTAHDSGRFDADPLCARCAEWHRP
ncbi:MAG: radical SAM protein [Phycisphaerae bacterium]|nr:radical SAM protein [Phycisphaerae bacterium]